MIPETGKVLVKFSASWCVNCKPLAKVIHYNPPTIPVIEVDIDDAPELAQQYNVRGVPTLILVENGLEVARKVGKLNVAQLAEFVG